MERGGTSFNMRGKRVVLKWEKVKTASASWDSVPAFRSGLAFEDYRDFGRCWIQGLLSSASLQDGSCLS